MCLEVWNQVKKDGLDLCTVTHTEIIDDSEQNSFQIPMQPRCKYGPVSRQLSTLKTNSRITSKVTMGKMMFDNIWLSTWRQ